MSKKVGNCSGRFSSWQHSIPITLAKQHIAVSQVNGSSWKTSRRFIELRYDGQESIDLAAPNTFQKVSVRAGGLLNLLTEVSDRSLHGPLSIAYQGPFAYGLWYKVACLVNTWLNEL